MQLIDLSQTLNKSTPVYPGDPAFRFQKAAVLEKNGYQDHLISFGNHNGTHVDAPSHMIKGGKNLNRIPIDQFFGNGIYIKVTNKKFSLKEIKKAGIKRGDIVLFHTGMSDIYTSAGYFTNYPAISQEIANYLVGKKVKMVGVDMCSVDHEPFPVHKTLLKNGILIIENLTNLKVLKGKTFKVYSFPLKLEIDGSPARVIAEIP